MSSARSLQQFWRAGNRAQALYNASSLRVLTIERYEDTAASVYLSEYVSLRELRSRFTLWKVRGLGAMLS